MTEKLKAMATNASRHLQCSKNERKRRARQWIHLVLGQHDIYARIAAFPLLCVPSNATRPRCRWKW